LTFYVISFKENLPEVDHNRWRKLVGGYAVYNTMNMHSCICTCCSIARNAYRFTCVRV